MATPGRGTTRQPALNYVCGESRARHRSRRLIPDEIQDDSIVWDLNDDGRPKTRRVNPQRLALRLDPELVAEMEAYIVPGAKMPPFSIRKDFQQRYSVDRRHIYDYFHSRGLRVAKEDKHTNLIRGRAMKAKVVDQTSLISPTPTKSLIGVTEDRAVDKAFTLSAPKSNEGALLERTFERTPKVRQKKSTVLRRSTAPKPLKRSRCPVSATLHSLPEVLSESSGDLSVSGTDTDFDSTSVSPQFTLACDSSDESVAASAISDFLPSPNDFLGGFFGAPDHVPQIFSEIGGFLPNEKLISVDSEHPMTKGERTELYDLISGSISSSVSVGAGQSSDVLFSADNTTQGGRLYSPENVGKSNLARNTYLAFEPAHPDFHDLRTWLSDDLDHQSLVDTHFFSRLQDSLSAGYYDASIAPIVTNDFGITGDYSQTATLSPHNRFLSSRVPVSFVSAKQHIAEYGKGDTENVHPGTYFNSR